MKPTSAPSLEKDPWGFSSGRSGYEREAFLGPTLLLPELKLLGWLRFHKALPGALRPGRHPGAFEIHYLVRGHLRWWVEKDRYDFNTGQVFVIQPDELHGGEEGSLQPCEHYWLQLQFPQQGGLPFVSDQETRDLRNAYERLTHRTFIASREVHEFFERLVEEHRHAQTSHSTLMARSLLHALLVTILRDHTRHTQIARSKPLFTWKVRRTLEWLEQQLYQQDLRLHDVAKNCGLSPAGLRARFKAETGYTLHDYLVQRRIKEARRRLAETPDDITSIAHELGFSSSQYFATVFRRETGMSPGEYRANHGAGTGQSPS